MKIISPFNGAELEVSSFAFSNHLRAIAKQTGRDFHVLKGELYSSIPPVDCSLCGCNMKFIKGKFLCEDIKCRKKTGYGAKKLISYFGEKAKQYAEFIAANLDFYLQNKNKTAVDPFDGKNCKALMLSAKRKLSSWREQPSLLVTKSCVICEKQYKENLLGDANITCGSKKCAGTELHNATFRRLAESFVSLYISVEKNIDALRNFSRDLVSANIPRKIILDEAKTRLEGKELAKFIACSFQNAEFLDVNGKTVVSANGTKYLSLQLDELPSGEKEPLKVLSCLICGNKFNDPRFKSKRFCSHACYHESLKKQNHHKFHSTEKKLEAGKKQSARMKDAIASGEFTPNVTNSWTNFDAKATINGVERKFRSSWEIVFFFFNQHLEYEKLRVRYVDTKGKSRTYIVDFIDKEAKVVYEIKPKTLTADELNVLKRDALVAWCHENGYTYSEISDEWFVQVLSEKSRYESALTVLGCDIMNKMKQFL